MLKILQYCNYIVIVTQIKLMLLLFLLLLTRFKEYYGMPGAIRAIRYAHSVLTRAFGGKFS